MSDAARLRVVQNFKGFLGDSERSGVGAAQARVTQGQRQPCLPLPVLHKLGGELVQRADQLGLKLRRHVLAKQAAQTPAGQHNRGADPEQGAR